MSFECKGLTFTVETSVLPGKDEAENEKKKQQSFDLEKRMKLAKEK